MKTFEISRQLLREDIKQAIWDREGEDSKYYSRYYSVILAKLELSELPQKVRNSVFFRDAAGIMPPSCWTFTAVLVYENKGFAIRKPASDGYACIFAGRHLVRKACHRKTITAAIADAVETWEYEQKGIL